MPDKLVIFDLDGTLAKAAGISPAETICIGDEVRDGDAARSARMAFGAVSWGYAHPDALRKLSPAVVLDRVEELAERLG